MLHTWYTTRNLASFYLQKSMWSIYPSRPHVIGAACMCYENDVMQMQISLLFVRGTPTSC